MVTTAAEFLREALPNSEQTPCRTAIRMFRMSKVLISDHLGDFVAALSETDARLETPVTPVRSFFQVLPRGVELLGLTEEARGSLQSG